MFLAVPFALGDRLAIAAAMLHESNRLGFLGEVLGWSAIAVIVVLPAAIVSGVQFPVLIALLGRGNKDVGRQVGSTYAFNTMGGILGSLAGGFGLIPLLSAVGAWRAVGITLAGLCAYLVARLPRRKLQTASGAVCRPGAPRGHRRPCRVAADVHRSHGRVAA